MRLRQCKRCDRVFKTLKKKAKFCDTCKGLKILERHKRTNWNPSPYYKRSQGVVKRTEANI